MKFPYIPVLLLILSMSLSACRDKEVTPDNAELPDSTPAAVAPQTDGTLSNRIRVRNIGRLPEIFNDSNHVQMKSARRLGIEPVTSLASSYFIRRPIIHIKSNDFYKVDTLSHSLPFP
ncbi:MAG: hypothetical protein K2I44_05180, partial [Muribaculaceae bacterium]|nr:hypothetical protein [Muribaculaceae bacterium]